MEVIILGSGTAVPEADRFPSGVLVVAGEQVVLVDLGPGVLRRMAQAGYGPEHLTAVLVTHFHTDHTADLAALGFALRNPRYAGRPKLTILGSPGLRALFAHLTAAWPWLAPQGYELELREIGPGTVQLGELTIDAVRVEHTAASLAYRITDAGGASAAFSGDADQCPGLVEVARDTDLFVCEAAFPDGGYVPGHLTPSLAARAAAQAGTRLLCLTHFYPECQGHDLRAQAAAEFGGRIELAEDLMRFQLVRSQAPSSRHGAKREKGA